jgi:hypothetical protein
MRSNSSTDGAPGLVAQPYPPCPHRKHRRPCQCLSRELAAELNGTAKTGWIPTERGRQVRDLEIRCYAAKLDLTEIHRRHKTIEDLERGLAEIWAGHMHAQASALAAAESFVALAPLTVGGRHIEYGDVIVRGADGELTVHGRAHGSESELRELEARCLIRRSEDGPSQAEATFPRLTLVT